MTNQYFLDAVRRRNQQQAQAEQQKKLLDARPGAPDWAKTQIDKLLRGEDPRSFFSKTLSKGFGIAGKGLDLPLEYTKPVYSAAGAGGLVEIIDQLTRLAGNPRTDCRGFGTSSLPLQG